MTATAHSELHPLAQPRSRGPHPLAELSRARLYAYARSLATVVRVDGQLDAANGRDVAQALTRFAGLKSPLILDLSQLSFVGVDGFRALLALNADLRAARVHCSVVPGPALRPLLRIVPDNGLALSESVAEALQTIDDVLQARRQALSDLIGRRRPVRPAATA